MIVFVDVRCNVCSLLLFVVCCLLLPGVCRCLCVFCFVFCVLFVGVLAWFMLLVVDRCLLFDVAC